MRVSESTEELEEELNRVLWGFELGGLIVAINVQDTGIGILSEHIPLIFNRFWRADQARNQREGGLGLGLAIALAIASLELMEEILPSPVKSVLVAAFKYVYR